MREGPSGEVLAGAARWWPVVSSWRGADNLAESIPVTGGLLTADAATEVPERLTFTVPAWADGRSWVPDGFLHPLAPFGQYVDLDIHVQSSVTGEVTATRMGRYQIQSWEDDDDGTVTVECHGLLQRVLDARLRVPLVPRPTGTLVSEFRRLVVPGLPVQVHADVVDRPCPQSFVWDEDRLAALYELVDAWPVRMRVDQFGTLNVLPPLPSQVNAPDLTWTDGARGTLVSAPRSGTRDRIANVVVARSSATDSPSRAPLQAVAVTDVHELQPATYGEVVRHWSSPLATTTGQLQKAAETMAARLARPALEQTVQVAPDPRVELDDSVLVVRDGQERAGWVNAYRMPLTIDGGLMSVSVGLA